MEKKDNTLWSDKIWESVDDSKQDSSEPEVNHQAETNLAVKRTSYFQSDEFWLYFSLTTITLFPFVPWLACCGIFLVILLNVIFWIIDEDDYARKTIKILLLIIFTVGIMYWSWKVFEAKWGGF
ncbi:MAG TPA: hypothetical protein D7H99_02565 [Candidatus Poseidoniales archaeon]|nr:MAG TPA: hypothetical protein D7H99_02565 [Candidatus Poseidoniales archaeon]HII57814.1 hypothetical protein [Candidatus Poseidoniaceae archaeon]